MHARVDSETILINSLAATAANAHDSLVLVALLHGGECRLSGGCAYTGQTRVIREPAPHVRTT